MLPALATLDQLEDRIGAISNEAAAQAALNDASALVRAEAPAAGWATDPDAEPPDVVVVVVLTAATRALRNPDGAQSESVGNYSVTYGAGLGGVWLTKNERRAVRQAASGITGIGSIELVSPWEASVRTVPVVDSQGNPAGEEIPWDTLGQGDL